MRPFRVQSLRCFLPFSFQPRVGTNTPKSVTPHKRGHDKISHAVSAAIEPLERRVLLSGAVLAQEATLTATNSSVDLGASVSIDGNTVVVGAPEATIAGIATGAVYVFTKPGSGWANMTQTALLTPSDGVAGEGFGSSVSISGGTVVIGADAQGVSGGAGKAYIFTGSGAAWTQAAELTPSDSSAGDLFGTAISISGSTVVVSAFGPNSQGAAYVFTGSGSSWTQAAKLTASDGAANDYFGNSVSISGNTVVAGGLGPTDGQGNKLGAAYVFTEPGSGWANMTQTARAIAFACACLGIVR